MRLYASLVACCAMLAAVASGVAVSGDQPARGWMTELNKAEAEARKLGVPLVIHFYADWCGPCRQMEADVLNRPEVTAEIGGRAIGVKINTDHRPDVVTRFGITALPSDVILAPDGKVLAKTTGFQDRAGYAARIGGFAAQYARLKPTAPQAETPIVATAEHPDDADKDEPVGLQGYSPVALTQNKQWVAGKPEYSWVHEGIEYRLASVEEFELFKQSPDRFAPQLLGCDPMILATTQRAVSGNIKYGAFWRGALYLFYSEENRSHFLQEPSRYTQISQAIEVDNIELLTAR